MNQKTNGKTKYIYDIYLIIFADKSYKIVKNNQQ